MSNVVRRLFGAAAVIVAMTSMAACGEDHPPVAPLAQISSESKQAAANGVDQLEPSVALDRALATLEDAGSYRVQGTTNSGSTLDIWFNVGVGSAGTVTAKNSVKIISANETVYVSGDPDAISEHVGASVDETVAGKWLLMSREPNPDFAIFTDSGAFANSVLGAEEPSTITGVATVNDQPAVGLSFPKSGATLWVSATGKPYPLRFEEKGASAGSGILVLSGFGEDVKVKAPAAASVVDISQLPTS